ncbi:hypothetical protein [Falsiroseomonas selenitidurans]|uniref:Uncharacterized protein n=1 Tax=Falsiroseomonas selenitidurans TaxID=2716335 RepID=A0ABX1E098_9PROT|nr:hypothetical protein [Falsiroseomonas selenitidurans]NKC30193.1 hypothetical protein [Falsiroseomonas selenitidurans]
MANFTSVRTGYGAIFGRRARNAGLLTGVTTGVLVGLSESPVAGVGITATLTLVAALAGSSASSRRDLFTRWHIFFAFATPLMAGIFIGMASGVYLRSKQPSPGDQLIMRLRELGKDNSYIADALVKGVQGGTVAGSSFTTDWTLRSDPIPVHLSSTQGTLPLDCQNRLLQPPPNSSLFSDTNIIIQYQRESRSDRFKAIDKWVSELPVPTGWDEGQFRLFLLSAARLGACGR